MSAAPFWSIEVDAIVADTTELTAEAFGALMLLMIAQWRNNGRPLSHDDRKLARISRSPLRRWRQVIRPEVESFFEITDKSWSQKRVAKDFIKVIEKIRKNRENGARGGNASALKRKKSSPTNAMLLPDAEATEGRCDQTGRRYTKDELEGRRIPPPPIRERGNPSSDFCSSTEPVLELPSPGIDRVGLHERAFVEKPNRGQNTRNGSAHSGVRSPSISEIEAWEKARSTLRLRSEHLDFKNLEPLELMTVDGNSVTLFAPTSTICERASELSGRIRDALQDAGLPIATVNVVGHSRSYPK